MSDVVVTTRSGQVRGLVRKSQVARFRGIPYAPPPVGHYRFRPPQTVESWEGVRDALTFGATAPKAPYPAPIDQVIPEVDIPGDDYLNLNVWTPSPGGRLPVMVFFHGGGFANGSNSIDSYDGEAFARDGVVLVSVNYRLGADGFLYLGDGDHANLGIQDQIAALRWVQDNIAAFGGDPANVTVFGESAGAMCIGMMLGMPSARGLFHKAILQSGATHLAIRPDSARAVAGHLAKILEVEPTRAALAQVPVDRLVLAQQQLRAAMAADPDPAIWGEAGLNALPFEPVIDGEVIPGPPLESLDKDVAILTGSNTEEYNLYLVPSGLIDVIDEARLTAIVQRYGLDAEKVIGTYRANRPGATPGELFSAIQTDWVFRVPAIRLAEQADPVWMYEFAWQPPTFGGRLGACHASELLFVFDNLHVKGFEPLLGADLPQNLADTMHSTWISFAINGNPGWPAYDTETRSTMRFGVTSELVTDPHPDERAIWHGHR